jgi:pimeloyl-ACP methyl ester carboxylesterase
VWEDLLVPPVEFDLQLKSGRVHARRHGSPDAPLVLAIPGLSANLMGFEFLAEHLKTDALQFVGVDLRGRGLSEVTAPGSYGWINHAADILEVADHLGASSFSLLGHSMGAAVAMTTVWQAPARVDRLVLVDLCGVPDPSTAGPIGAGVARLGAVATSAEQYLAQIKSVGVIQPWDEYWERYFRYELQRVDGGGVAARTSKAAVMEDVVFGSGALAFGDGAGVYGLWPTLTMPVLLLRATREMLPGTGYIVSQRDFERFPAMVPSATAVDIDANHYTIATSEPAAIAIARFLERRD